MVKYLDTTQSFYNSITSLADEIRDQIKVLLGSSGLRQAAVIFAFDHLPELMVLCPDSEEYFRWISTPAQLFDADAILHKSIGRAVR